MKILHVENLAGVPSILAKAQNESGHQAKVLETHRNPFNFPHDLELYYGGKGLLHDFKTMQKVSSSCIGYDLVHVHGGLNRKRLDVLGMHFIHRKPLVVHYHGSETRMGYGMAYRSLPDAKIVSRPDLLKWHEDAVFIQNPIEVVETRKFEGSEVPSVVHLTSNPKFKGTELIKEAMKELAQEGLVFRFELIENKSHAFALDKISSSHIVIDQVLPKDPNLPSIIGMVSLEAMARSKVVITTFDEEFRKYYPGCPAHAIEYGRSQLKDAVREFVNDMEATKKVGDQGMKYVKEFHSPKVVCEKLMVEYKKVVG
jgi:glycosyltransferase involved in cell wall biosynthesis